MSAVRELAWPIEAPERAEIPLRRVLDVEIADVDRRTVIDDLQARIDRVEFTALAFANAHCVNVAATDAEYRAVLPRFTVLADGIGVDLAAKLHHGRPFPENLNGTDFVPALLRALGGRRRVALVGGAPGVAEEAAENLRRALPRHEFRAVSHGYFQPGLQTEIVLARLREFSPDITLVALGVPKQELFIARHVTIRETTVVIAVGALFDFLSGRTPRAPLAWRRLRIEWLFRLIGEPSRLWRRYVLGNPVFLWRVFVELLARGRTGGR